MNYKQHSFAGLGFFSLGIVSLQYLDFSFDWITISKCMILSVIGSLIPDIDHPKAFLSLHLPVLTALFSVIFYLLNDSFLFYIMIGFTVFLFILPRFLNSYFGHRSVTHSFLLTFILFICLGVSSLFVDSIFLLYSFFLLLGVLSHLYVDGFTVSGVPFAYPVSKKRYRTSILPEGVSWGCYCLFNISCFVLFVFRFITIEVL